MTLRAALLAALLVSVGCHQPQRPYTFYAPPNAATVEDVVRALAVQGLSVERQDDRAGVVETGWVGSDFMWGSIDEQTAYVHRRFLVTLAPAGPDKRVVVRVDLKRCTGGGACAAIRDGIREQDQRDLDELARGLEDAMGGR